MTQTEYPVGANTEPSKLGASIAYAIKEGAQVVLKCVGAASVNQAIKGAAVARSFAVSHGADLVCVPWFDSVEIDGEERTAVFLLVKRQQP